MKKLFYYLIILYYQNLFKIQQFFTIEYISSKMIIENFVVVVINILFDLTNII